MMSSSLFSASKLSIDPLKKPKKIILKKKTLQFVQMVGRDSKAREILLVEPQLTPNKTS